MDFIESYREDYFWEKQRLKTGIPILQFNLIAGCLFSCFPVFSAILKTITQLDSKIQTKQILF
jgi:hypothetical protein